jgi:hypothetical protein
MNKEFMEIVLGLWDTYEDDAFIRDKKRVIFLNSYKMHKVDYRGKYFSLEGLLNLSPGVSPKFMDRATTYTDDVFKHDNTMEEAKGIADELRRLLVLKTEDFIVSLSHNPIVGRIKRKPRKNTWNWHRLLPKTACLCHYFMVQPKRLPTRCSNGTSPEQWIG